VLGCAILAGLSAGLYSDLRGTVSRLVQYDREILPNPDLGLIGTGKCSPFSTRCDRLGLASPLGWFQDEGVGVGGDGKPEPRGRESL
jgi:hypothetical protein